VKILYLYARRWYDAKMSIGRILYGEAIGRHPGVELRFHGVGWDGWDHRATVDENLAALGWKPDLIWVYKPEDYPTLPDCQIPKLVIFNEANAPKTLAEIYGADARLVGFHHPSDMPRWTYLESRRTLFTLPHCCDIDTVAKPLAERPVACLATGVRADKVYPLRGRMMDLIHKGHIQGTVRSHPGYRLKSNAEIRQQYETYRAELRSAKLSLCCSSVHKYPLAKYIESAAAGCLIVGDAPDDMVFMDTVGQYMVKIPDDADDDAIVDAVEYWLGHPREAQEMADAAKEEVRRGFQTSHYAERLVDVIGRHLGV
jgi:hypothetical protein